MADGKKKKKIKPNVFFFFFSFFFLDRSSHELNVGKCILETIDHVML